MRQRYPADPTGPRRWPYAGRVRVLVLGSGAREHAVTRALSRDPGVDEVIVAPGNAGIAQDATVVDVDAEDGAAVAALAGSLGVGLVVIGPEAPLIAGVADALRERGIPVFGPDARAAALEGSKAFAKQVMAEAGVPTGAAVSVTDADELDAVLDDFAPTWVVKADGLAAGKGVLVTADRAAARAHAMRWFEAGPVLLEEFLTGEEVSLFFVCDGTTAVPLSPAQDFKRLLDHDQGPNTGGMGAYSPLPWLADAFGSEQAFTDEVARIVATPVLERLAARGAPFVGLLYCGLVVDGTRIRVIEFNARFGDPETQVVLTRLASPLGALLSSAALGRLDAATTVEFRDDAAVTVVLASEGYPGTPVVGKPITGLDAADALPAVHVDHAATAVVDGVVVSAGGRVLSVTGVGETLAEARSAAYEGIGLIGLERAQHRTDIAAEVG